MENILILIVSVAIIANIFPGISAAYCGNEQFIQDARIPNYYTLLSLQEFDDFVVDQTMYEAYFGLIQPPPFTPDFSYETTITKDGYSLYTQSVNSVSAGENPVCNRNVLPLRPVEGLNRALFYRNETTTVQAVWSRCPDKYVWNMFCPNYEFRQRYCKLSETQFSIYINGNMDDLPMGDVVLDLFYATGVKFGAQNFKWFFTFRENSVC